MRPPIVILVLAMAFAGPALADTDPTLSQVYGAAHTGHLAQAQQMMTQVLRDHPGSAKAHYVAAELYAEARNSSMARQELNTAQHLDPGLPFASPESVRMLERKLSPAQPRHAEPASWQARSSFPWGTVIVVVAVVGVLALVLRRRRSPANVYSQYPGQYPGGAPTPPGVPGNPGAGVPPNVGGIGSGIAGGLASGLAVGAGVVAGEELAHHFLDSGQHEGSAPPAANEPVENPGNDDLGGPDFGLSNGNSWDDDDGPLGGDSSSDDWN